MVKDGNGDNRKDGFDNLLCQSRYKLIDNDNFANNWRDKDGNLLYHLGPHSNELPTYKGISANLKVLWEIGGETDKPLQKFGDDAPVYFPMYAKKHGFLSPTKHITKKEALLNHLIHQVSLRSFTKVQVLLQDSLGYRPWNGW